MMPATAPVPDRDVRIARVFRLWTVACGVALIAVTHRLWLPQTSFPRVPLIEAALAWPPWLDLLTFAALPCGLLLGLSPSRQRFGWLVFAAALVVAVLSNQHRLQPWAYQLGLLAIVFATASDARQVTLARILTIAIYAHSAHSKLDAVFFTDLGPRIARDFVTAIGFGSTSWSPTAWQALAMAMPVGELAVAVGLTVPRTRRIAAGFAIAMHVALLIAFGPRGANHEWGVLLWNVFFLGQASLLFGFGPSVGTGDSNGDSPSPVRREFISPGTAVVATAVLAPLLEPIGLFDHWPAWAVYSARTERVAVFVPLEVRDRLPEALFVHAEDPDWDGWCRVRIDRWSLAELGVPVYPQERFRIGIALALAEHDAIRGHIRVHVAGVPNRFTGSVTTDRLEGLEDLREQLGRFRWNARPR